MLFSGAGVVPPLCLAAGRCFLIRGGLSAALPPFRLCEQRESFSCFPFFPYHGEERTICLPSRPNFLFPSLLFGAKNELFLSPLPFGGGGYLVFCPPSPVRGREKRFPETRKRSWSFWRKKRTASIGNGPEKIKAIPPPRARKSGRAAPPTEREARGCLPAPQIRCARKREDRCRVLKYWRAFPPSRR